jgi:anaerobic magnesium-protoporphyrin IX monomethyl ester cyclase
MKESSDMRTTDCLVIGFNDTNFEEYVHLVRSMGGNSGAFKDLDLAFIELDGKPYHSLGVLNHFYAQNKNELIHPYHNADFLWPVVLYLCSYLAKHGYRFDYINLFQQEKESLKEKLRQDNILSIAITTTLYVSPHPILEMISFIRQYNTTAKIIVGGPYISNQFKALDEASVQSLFTYLGADLYVTCQEGEFALTQIIQALKAGEPLEQVDNIAFKKEDRFVLTQCSVESNSLEENTVNYALFPREQIGQFISTRTAKSCPFACAFCGFPQRAGKYTYTDLEFVEKELDEIANIGTVTTLTFLDDTFNVPKGRFKEILRMMIRNRYGFRWNSFYRSDHGDEETIELMREAGCEGVFLGAESGSDTMLKHMNKTSRRKDYVKAITSFKQAGISTYTSLIVGFPGETYETVQETIGFLEEAQPDFFRAQLWYCDPITPIWQKREEYGISGMAFNWSHKTMDSQTACDLIDYMFLSIENSIWLPQFGFEQWSLFYLQRRGMRMEQIRTFLRCFNTATKEKLIQPKDSEIHSQILKNLKESCHIDEPVQLGKKSIDLLSGAEYRAAEQYWIDEFRDYRSVSPITRLAESEGPAATSSVTVTIPLEPTLLSSLATSYGVEQSSLLVATLGLFLSSLNKREEVAFIAGQPISDTVGVFAVRVLPKWDASFEEYARAIDQKTAMGIKHHLYALHLLANPTRMALHDLECPTFDISLMVHNALSPSFTLDEALHLYPSVREGIVLSIDVVADRDEMQLIFTYAPNRFERSTIMQIGQYLESIIAKAHADPHIDLRDLAPVESAPEVQELTDRDAEEVFNF